MMKLLSHPIATSPRRVTIYLREKGIDLAREDIDVAAGEHRQPAFLAKNPEGKIPVLELDDGTYLSESAAIIEYLEEVHPEPPMIGTDFASRGRTRAADRMVTLLIDRTGLWLHHSHPFFAARGPQDPAVARAMTPVVEQQLGQLDRFMGDSPFLAGERVTIADCSLFAIFQNCRGMLGLPYGAGHPNLDAWFARFAVRPSAAP
jgi:glutathione S-transferase